MSSPSLPDAGAIPPPATLAIHLDLVGGVAGDMFVAAMVDALPALGARVLAELSQVQPAGAGLPAFRDVSSGGLRARHFGLAHGAAHAPAHDHREGHGHDGTPYADLRDRLAAAPLSPSTRVHALALLALLADAEAEVHGIAVEAVHFHELADWDSLLDIVAAGCLAAALDGAQWSASAPPPGGGPVRTAHGVLPVPAPATSRLLLGYPWHDDGIGGERVTPTGAAILRHLVAPAACGAQRASGRLVAVGSGAGTRALPGTPNIVRALVFERAADAPGDTVTVVEFDVDDMSGEEIAVAADRLRAESGVIDLSIGTRLGKKGRPATDFRLLVQPPAVAAVTRACFVETATLGLRLRDERRRLLPRAESAIAVAGGAPVNVKVAQRPGGEHAAKAAQDDVAATPGLAARRRNRAAGEQRALHKDDE